MGTHEPSRLSSPHGFLVRTLVVLALVAAVAALLHRQIATVLVANPGLDALLLAILAFGIVSGILQILRLSAEARWADAALAHDISAAMAPRLLAPLASLLGEKPFSAPVAPSGLRAALESIAMRLDETRDLFRYLTKLLVFLGLLGTFWGLVQSLASIAEVIGSLQAATDTSNLFDDLRKGIDAPIAGMSLAFGSALVGLAGSLVLGFVSLQVGGAQARFLGELEAAMTAAAAATAGPLAGLEGLPPDLRAALEKIAATADHSHARATMVAVADLADGVQRLVGQMRSEQQLIREWVEARADHDREIKLALDRLSERAKEPAA